MLKALVFYINVTGNWKFDYFLKQNLVLMTVKDQKFQVYTFIFYQSSQAKNA